jgi:hypothetical protein
MWVGLGDIEWALFLPIVVLPTVVIAAWRAAEYLKERRRAAGQTGEPSGQQVVGVAIARATLRAPCSGRPVIGYHLTLEGLFDDDAAWTTVIDLSEVTASFQVDTSDGAVDVRADRARLELAPDLRTDLPRQALLGSPLRELLHRHGVPDHSLVTARRLRCTERRLENGDAVRLRGALMRAADPQTGGSHRQVTWRLQLVPLPGETLVVQEAGC